MLTKECYNQLNADDKALVDSINKGLSKQKETRMNILWCDKECLSENRDLFPSGMIDLLERVNPTLHKLINTEYNEVVDYVNAAADFYLAMEDLAYDYDAFVLPDEPVFLAHFFYHAGIEMSTDKQEVKCFVTNDNGHTFSAIMVLV
jgi:hypothetical protein